MKARGSRRPRQADIARLAGVSQTTVSLVLNGQSGDLTRIPEATRTRIIELAHSLGYVANPMARSLAGGRSELIGLYTFESVFPVDHHNFYHPFLVGIESAAEQRGYDVLLFTSATGGDGERSIYRNGVNRLQLADGCVLLGKEMDYKTIARLRDDGYHFVLIGRREIPGGGVTYVTAAYRDATRQVMEHLHGLGHRRIAYLPAAMASEPADDRDAGFRDAVDELGLPTGLTCPVEPAGPQVEQVRALVDAGATAFVCHESVVALRTVDLFADLGLRVPEDVSVAALNDPPDGAAGPALTCFRIPRREMGQQAVELLVRQMTSEQDVQPQALTLPCVLVLGETSGAPRQEMQ
jgi:DNA-binding LacI/PurR family transcriptional regulator